MRWRGRRKSTNVEDRRGRRTGMRLPGTFSGRGGRRMGKGGLVVTALLALGLYFMGIDPRILLQGGGEVTGGTPSSVSTPSPEQDRLVEFVSVVLADTEDTWHTLFQQMGSNYREPGLVLFSDMVRSACGTAQSAMGPFYCPADEKVYIDLDFYQALKNQLGAPGDFAQAYVIAHEVGHHVQHLMGISGEVQSMRQRVGEAQGNRLSVRLELQADCFAGVWGYHAEQARDLLEAGDIEEAMIAAGSIGDDRLQRDTRGRVTPESFTHGTSAQRVRWFERGIESGDPNACDTFAADSL